ncbi:MAG: DUF4421 family protein [Flavobacteriales bacterium]|nr:DUF4421 family protein [Flavobacteriales bacterium]
MRRSILFLFIIFSLNAQAQLGDKMRAMLVGDTLAPPDHDTAYIATYRSNLVISAVGKLQLVDVDVEQDSGGGLSYSTNSMEQYGFGLDYKWLSVEATFNVPAFSDYDASLGKTSSKGLGVGFTGRRLWARGFWNTTQGYYLNDPERWTGNDAPVVRPDLSNRTFLLSAHYALSGKRRYSENAANFQMERQKKSAGTFVAGLSAWHTTITADSSLLSPALVDTFQLATGFSGLQRLLIGATIGYVHTFSFWQKGFIHASVLPGFTYADQTITTPTGDLHGTGIAAVTEFKLGAGFNGDRWYGALTTSFYYSTTPIAEKLSLGTNYGYVRLALGIRLGDPGIKALGAVGL